MIYCPVRPNIDTIFAECTDACPFYKHHFIKNERLGDKWVTECTNYICARCLYEDEEEE